MTTVLVTGATGFLGEHLCKVLVEQGHTVRGLARSRSGVLSDLGVEHVRGDVLSADDLDKALAGCQAVFHLAGAVSRDPDDAQRMMRLQSWWVAMRKRWNWRRRSLVEVRLGLWLMPVTPSRLRRRSILPWATFSDSMGFTMSPGEADAVRATDRCMR